MRLKSELWVKAFLRRAAVAGAPGVVVRRGDSDAGIILIKIARLDGTADYFGPAPAGFEGGDNERRWVPIAEKLPEAEIEARLAREIRNDSDLWVLEIEDRQGRHFLEGWLATA